MFFPLMKIPNLVGWVNLVNFPPNQWEYRKRSSYFLYLLYSEGDRWKTIYIDKIKFGDNILLNTDNFKDVFSRTNLALIYPTRHHLEPDLSDLPSINTWSTELPAWRASSGFKNPYTQVSYQSDLHPLPSNGSLLTFHPFIQFGELSNFLLVLNAQVNPKIENHNLYIFNSKTKELIDEVKIQTNRVSLIGLDKYKFKQTDLPVFICPTMAAVPFGLGISSDTKGLSLEHTHPPGSFVVRGDRNKIQKQIKSEWFKALKVDTLS
jgi:hypothetical protein